MLSTRSATFALTLALLGACATSNPRPARPPPPPSRSHVERHPPRPEGYDAEQCTVSDWKPGPNGCAFSKTLKTGCEAEGPCPSAENVQFQGTLACDESRSVCGRVETCHCPLR